MDLEKINIQMHMEDLLNTVNNGNWFKDRHELSELRCELYNIIEEFDKYEIKNFNIDKFVIVKEKSILKHDKK